MADRRYLYQQIKLTKGKYALVDKEDFEYLNQWKWFCSTTGYAVRTALIDGEQVRIRMHRVVANTPEDMCTDHINMNRLDNRGENLRVVDRSQNNMNRKLNKNSTTGYKGVTLRKDNGKYRAHIQKDGKKRWLGQFDTAIEAAKAYNSAAKKIFGEYAKLNILENYGR
jgi:hypothetical protein